MTFGQNLQQMRRQAGLSQQQLAERLGVSRQAISKWELNATKPDIDNVIQLSKLFSISIDELLTGEKPQNKQNYPQPVEKKGQNRKEYIFSVVLIAVGVLGLILASLIAPWMQWQAFHTFGQCYTDATEYLRHYPLVLVVIASVASICAGCLWIVIRMARKINKER